MKLNTDCIRSVLLTVENLQRVFVNDEGNVEKKELWIEDIYAELPGYGKEDIFYSLFNLEQAGYVDTTVQWVSGCVNECAINHLTYEGHEFLEEIRDASKWSTVKKGLTAVRNYSLSAIASIAEGITSAAIGTYISKQ